MGGVKGRNAPLALVALALLALGGCGLDVQSPDLFLLTRSGQGPKLTMVVSDGGTIRCNGSKPKAMSDAMLIQARDLSDNLAQDASANLTLPPRPGTIFEFRIKLQQGMITFSDRDTSGHKVLAQAELFAVQAAQQVCGLSG
jgi:hypothetical protein